jgi:hypothetical protein
VWSVPSMLSISFPPVYIVTIIYRYIIYLNKTEKYTLLGNNL